MSCIKLSSQVSDHCITVTSTTKDEGCITVSTSLDECADMLPDIPVPEFEYLDSGWGAPEFEDEHNETGFIVYEKLTIAIRIINLPQIIAGGWLKYSISTHGAYTLDTKTGIVRIKMPAKGINPTIDRIGFTVTYYDDCNRWVSKQELYLLKRFPKWAYINHDLGGNAFAGYPKEVLIEDYRVLLPQTYGYNIAAVFLKNDSVGIFFKDGNGRLLKKEAYDKIGCSDGRYCGKVPISSLDGVAKIGYNCGGSDFLFYSDVFDDNLLPYYRNLGSFPIFVVFENNEYKRAAYIANPDEPDEKEIEYNDAQNWVVMSVPRLKAPSSLKILRVDDNNELVDITNYVRIRAYKDVTYIEATKDYIHNNKKYKIISPHPDDIILPASDYIDQNY